MASVPLQVYQPTCVLLRFLDLFPRFLLDLNWFSDPTPLNLKDNKCLCTNPCKSPCFSASSWVAGKRVASSAYLDGQKQKFQKVAEFPESFGELNQKICNYICRKSLLWLGPDGTTGAVSLQEVTLLAGKFCKSKGRRPELEMETPWLFHPQPLYLIPCGRSDR